MASEDLGYQHDGDHFDVNFLNVISLLKRRATVNIGETLKERAELLEGAQWTEDFSRKEIEIFVRYLDTSRIKKDTPVFHEGAREAYMCIVVKGSVKVLKQNEKHQGKTLSVLPKGKTFGEMVLFDGEPRSATIVSVEDTVLLILTKENLDRLIKESPGLAAKILLMLGKLLSQRLRVTSGMLVDFIG
jgi:CRP/FNR family transcriptional regulator, cyclic AMP receptor protein